LFSFLGMCIKGATLVEGLLHHLVEKE
jgi:hypothetical protein